MPHPKINAGFVVMITLFRPEPVPFTGIQHQFDGFPPIERQVYEADGVLAMYIIVHCAVSDT